MKFIINPRYPTSETKIIELSNHNQIDLLTDVCNKESCLMMPMHLKTECDMKKGGEWEETSGV